MRQRRVHNWTPFIVPLVVFGIMQACQQPASVEVINVSLKNTEVYQYRTAGGDEDGARITIQPTHYTISEIRRDSQTNWLPVYVYQPAAGFVGTDNAELELRMGSDGASAPTAIRKIVLHFEIHN